ncbi:MAG: AMP-binding protein [Puniceicoccales bacterium]|jgi:O-succinylbenzoic acid--CoA ligase|nr:AMP-binding protein [Puniceicoccales bacterium]
MISGDTSGALFSRASIECFLGKQLFPEVSSQEAKQAYENALAELKESPADSVVIACSSFSRYIGLMLASLAANRSVYCANPHWREQEWDEAGREIPAGTVWLGSEENASCNKIIFQGDAFPSEEKSVRIFIPTGGTGGKVRFMAHNEMTLAAAARAQCAVFGKQPLDSVSPLPPWHISGIMPVVRAMVSAGRLQLCDGSFGESIPLPNLFSGSKVPLSGRNFLLLSVVPTQLRRILAKPDGATWLRQFDCVLLGGAATSPDLLEQAREEGIRIGIGYGMTETAAFVAVHLPGDFLEEKPVSGTVLSHAGIRILDTEGNAAAEGEHGRVVISADSLADEIGAVDSVGRKCLYTQDEGFLRDGRLYLLGRLDRHIITGGEKVDPRRVEEVLAGTSMVKAVLVVGEPDAEWGMRIVALVELNNAPKVSPNWQNQLSEYVRSQLARHCVPRRWIAVSRLPFNERGKLDRGLLAELLAPVN